VKKNYRTYGLTLQSDLAITGLLEIPDGLATPDISAEFAALPSWAAQAQSLPVTSVSSRPADLIPGDTSFRISEFADERFFQLLYGDGTQFLLDCAVSKIWGAPGPGLSHDDLCVYFLGPVMGFVLRQRGVTALHASSVCFHEKSVALIGEAGAGKSTTAAALSLRGWPVLCEDVCAIHEVSGKYQVLPAYPRISLWPDSVDLLFQSPGALPLIVRGWEKRYLALNGERASFATAPAPLAAIFFLAARSNSPSAPVVESISQREALLHLVQNTYMNWYLDKRQRAQEFDFLTRVIAQVECFRVTPSSDPGRLQILANLIEAQALRACANPSTAATSAAQPNV
jgi:hypothetical protein